MEKLFRKKKGSIARALKAKNAKKERGKKKKKINSTEKNKGSSVKVEKPPSSTSVWQTSNFPTHSSENISRARVTKECLFPSPKAINKDDIKVEICFKCKCRLDDAVYKCSQCNHNVYCSPQCAHDDWEYHRMICSPNCRIDSASNFEGDGLFASRDFKRGEPIVIESPLLRIPSFGDKHWIGLKIGMSKLSATERRRYFELANVFPDHPRDSGVVETNGVSLGMKPANENLESGVFAIYSKINHSCAPNVQGCWNVKSNEFWISAIRDIKKDEELFTTYCDLLLLHDERQERLRDNFHFICKCERCSLTGKELVQSEERTKIVIGVIPDGFKVTKKIINERYEASFKEGIAVPGNMILQERDYALTNFMMMGDIKECYKWLSKALESGKFCCGEDSLWCDHIKDIREQIKQAEPLVKQHGTSLPRAVLYELIRTRPYKRFDELQDELAMKGLKENYSDHL